MCVCWFLLPSRFVEGTATKRKTRRLQLGAFAGVEGESQLYKRSTRQWQLPMPDEVPPPQRLRRGVQLFTTGRKGRKQRAVDKGRRSEERKKYDTRPAQIETASAEKKGGKSREGYSTTEQQTQQQQKTKTEKESVQNLMWVGREREQ